MSNNKHGKAKRMPRSEKVYEVNDVQDITEEIEITLSALRMQMAQTDYRDPEAVLSVRGKLDKLVEKVAEAVGTDDDRSKKGILAQLGKKLFSAPPIINDLAAKVDDK